MRSHAEGNAPEAAPEQPQPAPAQPTPAPTKPGLSLEERVERLEKRLVAIIGEL